MRMLVSAIVALTLLPWLTTPALAAWPNQSTVNLPVCTGSDLQQAQRIVSDGAGGAIVTWADARSTTSWDLYAQHLLPSGVVDPAWPANGLGICILGADQGEPTIVSDGSGGAIIAWTDSRGGSSDIYAQHVRASGVVDPTWPANGRALCTAGNQQGKPVITSDGSGGAIVSWEDNRFIIATDIYAQHVLASGAVDPSWPADGLAVCTANSIQWVPTIVSDGTGGAIIAWYDLRGSSFDIYAQHVLAAGAVDPAWPLNGYPVCAAANSQDLPTLVSDGSGGAIVTWQDSRTGSLDIYAQHMLASGSADPSWTANGVAVSTAAGSQASPTITSDGAGGALVSWFDTRAISSADIYAHHLLSSGTVDPAWPVDGRALCSADYDQQFPMIVSDGAGGGVVTWEDARNGVTWDVYAQHVQASGSVDPGWPANGRALSTAGNDQRSPVITSDGGGGVIAVWEDLRSGARDIYAQRVARFGYIGTPEAEMAGVKDIPNDNGGKVRVSWTASYLESEPYSTSAQYHLFRSVPTHVAAQAIARGARTHALTEEALQPGDMVGLPAGATTLFWELVASVNSMGVPGYSYVAATTGDSLGAGNPKTLFMVQTRSNASFWNSPPDSGYSVDNVPPAAPAPFTALYSAGTTQLQWNPNLEADLVGYRLYRGLSPSFVPSLATLLASPADPGFTDLAGVPYVYKLTAIDIHGNESPVATVVPSGTTDVGDGPALSLAFAAPSPNPASGRAMLRWTTSRAGHVRLSVFDAAGRRVATLHDGEQPAGKHAASFALRDAAGRELASGIYLLQLEAEGRVLTRRLATIR